MNEKIDRNYNKGFEDIVNHFASFDLDSYHDEIAKTKILELTLEIQKLKGENKKLKTKVKYYENKQDLTFKQHSVSFEQTQEKIKENYPELSDNGLKALATAEHLFKNEKSNLDYSNIYSSYIKALEIEIKRCIPAKRKSTFGSLLIELEKRSEFRTFVKTLETSKIAKIRNRGVHSRSISKNECGNLRKLLLEEGWLKRILFLLSNLEVTPINENKQIKTLIIGIDKKVKIGKTSYNSYQTDSYEYLLSRSNLAIGSFYGEGRIVEVDDLEYILLS